MDKCQHQMFFKLHIFCCVNKRGTDDPRRSCGERGSEELYRYFKDKCRDLGIKGIRVNAAGCMGFCKFGPTVVVYPDGVWYSCNSQADIDCIIDSHIINGNVYTPLLLQTLL